MEVGMVECEGGDLIFDSVLLLCQVDVVLDSNVLLKLLLLFIFQCIDSQGGGYLYEYEVVFGCCELMIVQGLGGVILVNVVGCEVVCDCCEELLDVQCCSSWQ